MEEQNKKRYLSPLRSMDFYLIHFQALLKQLRLQNDLSEIERVLDRKVEASVVEILESAQYEALVVTDLNKKIVWVNNGFFDMTGYPKGFAIGKKPTFLLHSCRSRSSLLRLADVPGVQHDVQQCPRCRGAHHCMPAGVLVVASAA